MTPEERIEDRWERGLPHHPEAVEVARALAAYLPSHDIRFGGDGDFGEDIQYALSLWIEDGKPSFRKKDQ